MANLIKLLIAHFLGDFFLQPGAWVAHKEQKKWKSPYLYLHAGVHFALILALFFALNGEFAFVLALVASCLHWVIDGIKLQWQQQATKPKWFIIDQLLHLACIVGIAYANKWIDIAAINTTIVTPQNLVVICGALLLTVPASFIIKAIISRWTPTSTDAGSLINAGSIIGMLERLLILTFILFQKWEGVGFLLTAKSVFRFGDLKEAQSVRLTEYVMIGTLLSFSIGIFTAVLCIYINTVI